MPDTVDFRLAKRVTIGGKQIEVADPPTGLIVHGDLGILSHEAVSGQVIHRTDGPDTPLYETRATITPGGDYLLMFPEGKHYGRAGTKVNQMLAYRSSDRGQTWSGPTGAFDIDYNQHGFIPLIPRGSSRIYAFGTQPMWDMYSRERGLHENAPIGYRISDDDGHTWSEVRIIRPENDPGFRGMSVMRMCETGDGTWLLGSHEGDWSYRPLQTRQYVLRSQDQGQTWQVLPYPRHGGWGVLQYGRMDEGRPINLGDGRVLMLARTPEGHLWELRSEDDGRTWSDPRPTVLVHPDAPPMLCHLSDEKTLVALHHNRHSVSFDKYTGLGSNPEAFRDRSEIWVSTSTDEGRTWSEPRFIFVNALSETLANDFRNYQCSYIDVFVDGDQLHLFVPHRWRQVLHLRFNERDLDCFPSGEELT
jgi:Neuraminidase (sialidase)